MAAPVPSDYAVERRLLRRQVSFWRVAAIVLAILAVLVAGWRLSGAGRLSTLTPHIARLTISGLITGDRDTLRLIKRIENSNAAAVLVSIDSPGGTTAGSERIYDALRRLSAKKPTVAVVGTLAASGAYVAALATDQIVVQGNSLVGSIGVIMQYPNLSKLLDSIGVKVEDVKSSPLKAEPNFFEPTSPEARAALEALVADSYSWFKALVKERRGMDESQLATVADGRVFTGRQSIDLRLVDRLGDEREAIAWLEKVKNVSKDLPVRDWKKSGTLGGLDLTSVSAQMAQALGFDSLARLLDRGSAFAEQRLLDGLLSIWQVDRAD